MYLELVADGDLALPQSTGSELRRELPRGSTSAPGTLQVDA